MTEAPRRRKTMTEHIRDTPDRLKETPLSTWVVAIIAPIISTVVTFMALQPMDQIKNNSTVIEKMQRDLILTIERQTTSQMRVQDALTAIVALTKDLAENQRLHMETSFELRTGKQEREQLKKDLADLREQTQHLHSDVIELRRRMKIPEEP